MQEFIVNNDKAIATFLLALASLIGAIAGVISERKRVQFNEKKTKPLQKVEKP